MRCLACGVEMQLVRVVPDETAPIPGYAHHTFECSACHDTETRLLFSREPAEPAPTPAALEPGPPGVPASAAAAPVVEDEPRESAGAWARALDMLRGRQSVLGEAVAAPAADASQPPPRAGEHLVPRHRDAAAAEPAAPPAAIPAAGAEASSSSAWSRAKAMLRRRQERS